MRLISLAIVTAAISIAAPAVAKTNTQDQPTAASSEKKVCKKLHVTGSRMGERVCLTKDEWKKVEQVK